MGLSFHEEDRPLQGAVAPEGDMVDVIAAADPAAGVRTVVHCHGHGGAGVTLSWGCADEVARLVAA